MAAEGMANKEIAAALGIDANKVGRWRTRYAQEGPSAIEKERPRGANHGGKDSRAQAALRARVLEATTQTVPADATHWSCRSMARHLDTTHSFVNRVWRSHGLKPHLIRTFKLSNDPRFEEKLQDVVGLYLDPPEPYSRPYNPQDEHREHKQRQPPSWVPRHVQHGTRRLYHGETIPTCPLMPRTLP